MIKKYLIDVVLKIKEVLLFLYIYICNVLKIFEFK